MCSRSRAVCFIVFQLGMCIHSIVGERGNHSAQIVGGKSLSSMHSLEFMWVHTYGNMSDGKDVDDDGAYIITCSGVGRGSRTSFLVGSS